MATLEKLEVLYAESDSITDVSVFKDMQNLKILYLTNDSVEDVTPLSSVETLEELNIEGNYVVSMENVGDLMTALPNCKVIHSDLKTALELELANGSSDNDRAEDSDIESDTDIETDTDSDSDTDSKDDSDDDSDSDEELWEDWDDWKEGYVKPDSSDTDELPPGSYTITAITEYYE